ncbi:MAG: hypothetical protein GWN62_16865 [Aliifodinibius sp.]|nr:hypothetical protein [Fodinibius sp.]
MRQEEKDLLFKALCFYMPYALIGGKWFDENFLTQELHSGNILAWAELDTNTHKPILRPLSDLTKEIEHNGERFIPIKNIGKTSTFYGDTPICNIEKDYRLWAVWEFEKLLEWHFDIFGLIEKGLAIDINTTSKQ